MNRKSSERRARMALAEVGITLGDLSGIGPELVDKTVRSYVDDDRVHFKLLSTREELACLLPNHGDNPELLSLENVTLADVGTGPLSASFEVGKPSKESGVHELAALRAGLQLARSGKIAALVYAPLSKQSLYLAGMTEHDECEWLGRELGGLPTTEISVTPWITTGRVSSHVPLRDVHQYITVERIISRFAVLQKLLEHRGVVGPRIAVCALNPHGGDGGGIGREEIDVIQPAVERLRVEGQQAVGPVPADTAFVRAARGEFDGVLTMYHDQGQIATKLNSFLTGVTVVAGADFPIMTAAQGCAYGLVGSGEADPGALINAVRIAAELTMGDEIGVVTVENPHKTS